MRLPSLALAALASLAACGKAPEAETPNGADAAPAAPASLKLGDDGLPRMRAGLWEVVKTDGGETETTRHCAGAEVDAEMREMMTRDAPGCRMERSAGPTGIRIKGVCEQAGGLKTETDFVMTGSESAYDMKLGIYLVKPDGTREGGDVVAKAKWIGACPAGATPGEDIEP
jgi:hypothetical protein